MIEVARIARRGRIDRANAVVVVLPAMVAPAAFSIATTGASARGRQPFRSASPFRSQVRGIDDVLDAHRNAAQRSGILRAGVFGTADEGADGLFMRVDRLERLGDRRIGGKIAGVDTALEFGKRQHRHRSLIRPNSF